MIGVMIGQILIQSDDKTHILVVTVKLIWLLFLNILSFNFIPKPNKSLGFTRFRRSYLKRPAAVLIKVTLHFQLMCAVPSDHVFFCFFCSHLSPMIVHSRNLFLLSSTTVRIMLTQRSVSRQKDVKQLSINISELKVGVNHSISPRTTFSPNP